MPVSATLAKVTRVDFFAALPSGLYTVLVGFALFGPQEVAEPTPEAPYLLDEWGRLGVLAVHVQHAPALLLVLLFAAYLTGSLWASLPVGWADGLWATLRVRLERGRRRVARARIELAAAQGSGPRGAPEVRPHPLGRAVGGPARGLGPRASRTPV